MFLSLIPFALAQNPIKNVTEEYQCSALGEMPGPEDFDWFQGASGPELLVSADARRPGEAGGGGLYHAREGVVTQLPLNGRDACSLHPHGLSLRPLAEGGWELWVVNHHAEADATAGGCALPQAGGQPLLDSLERYRFDGAALTYVERVGSPLLTDPNDLDRAPDGTVYISNNPNLKPGQAVLAILLRRTPSTLVRYRAGEGFTEVADGFFYANGTYVAPDGAVLLSTYAGHVYAFRPTASGVDEVAHTRLRGALDNFLVDERGELWLTGHPSTRRFLGHVKDGAKTTPSDIYHLRWDLDRFSVVEHYYDDGLAAQAVSTAVVLDGQLILAQVFQPGLVVCTPR